MTEKLSPYKVSKMMALYFSGYSQTDIANKLNIDQSTISLYVTRFKSLVEQQDLQAAAEEYGVMDEIKALHSLAAELKQAKLTVEEAKVGLRLAHSLQKLGIEQEDYKDIIQACMKMKSEGFISDAVKLNKLENATGMTHGELIDQYANTQEKLKKEQQELQLITVKLSEAKKELANIDNQKKAAHQGLKAYMNQVGADMNRIKLVEDLAQTLKEAGEDDKQLEDYIQRQHLLIEAGMTLGVFVEILEKAKSLTAKDGGKELLTMLNQYGSLAETINGLKNKVQSLTKEADGLEDKAKLKGKLEADIIKLQAEKVSLETCVADSLKQKQLLEDIQNQVSLLTKKRASLKSENANLQAHNQQLTEDVHSKKEIVSDLGDLEKKHNAVASSVAEMEARLEREKRRLDITESFIGLVQSAPSSLGELEKFAAALPGLIDQAKQMDYSPTLLKAHVLEKLTGGALLVLRCKSCGAGFSVDKPPAVYGYHCPCCGSSSQIITDKEELTVLKEALATLKPQVIVPQIVVKHPKPNAPQGDKGVG